MGIIHIFKRETPSLGNSVKAVALVVIIGIVATVTDHGLFASGESARAPDTPAATYSPGTHGDFEVPAHLRANAGEVQAPVETF